MKQDRYYQWLPNSGNDGDIVKLRRIYVENDIKFYEFSDGEICNEEFIAPYTTELKNLKNKMLVELSSKNDIWETEYIKSKSIIDKDIQSNDGNSTLNKEIPPLEDISNSDNGLISQSSVGKFRLIAPKEKSVPCINYFDYMSDEDLIKIGLKEAPIENIIETPVVETPSISATNIEDNTPLIVNECKEKTNINTYIEHDPISILVNASSKKEINIPMELCIELPSKELFNIAKNNFENGAEKFIEVILADIEYETFKNSLREALISAYNSD